MEDYVVFLDSQVRSDPLCERLKEAYRSLCLKSLVSLLATKTGGKAG